MMNKKSSSVSPHHETKIVGCRSDRGGIGGQGGADLESSVFVARAGEALVGESQGNTEGEMQAEVEQEVERIACLPTYQPTKSDYDDHCVTHCPYRPWCRHCVEGRGQEFGHFRRREKDSNRVPLVSFDYAGLSDKGEVVELKFEPGDESATKVLVVALRTADDRQTCVFGHVVPQKRG